MPLGALDQLFSNTADDQRRLDLRVVTGLVEVLQVQRVIPHLIDVLRRESPLPDLELEDKDRPAQDDHGIDAPTQTGNDELEKQMAADLRAGQRRPKVIDLVPPRIALRQIDVELAARGQAAKNALAGGTKECCDRR